MSELPFPKRSAVSDTWIEMGDVCTFELRGGGESFNKRTDYTVSLSSDSCAELKLRDPVRTKESITTYLSTIPIVLSLENANKPDVEGAIESVEETKHVSVVDVNNEKVLKSGNLLTFQVTSLSALNRILKQEIAIKPCRCRTYSCDQTVDLSVRLLKIDADAHPLIQYKQKYFTVDQEYLDVTSSCTYQANVMPNIQVASAEVLTLSSGEKLDISKAFVFHGMATLISDALDLRLDLT